MTAEELYDKYHGKDAFKNLLPLEKWNVIQMICDAKQEGIKTLSKELDR